MTTGATHLAYAEKPGRMPGCFKAAPLSREAFSNGEGKGMLENLGKLLERAR